MAAVNGFTGVIHKSFKTRAEADAFIRSHPEKEKQRKRKPGKKKPETRKSEKKKPKEKKFHAVAKGHKVGVFETR